MDKYELNIKLEQMRKLIKRKEYNTASKIADTIEWNRIKSNQDLMMAADVYEASGKLVNAREVLLYAYERTNLGRQIVYRLCRVATKLGDIDEAEEFYGEYVRMASGDNSRYILQYEISRARGSNLDTQIAILSKYLDEEMDDRWAYELAKLYHKSGNGQECAKMCDTIILWFSDGKYVEKALELKSLYAPLTKEQQSRVFKESIIPVIDRTDEVEDAKMVLNEMQGIQVEDIHVTDYSNKVSYDTVNIQKELAASMKDIFGDELAADEADKVEDEAVEVTEETDENAETPEDLEKTKEISFGTTKVFVPISKQQLGEVDDMEEISINEEIEAKPEPTGEMEEVVAEEVEDLEEAVDEDHIEGQLTIDEVLSMFNLDVGDEVGEVIPEVNIELPEVAVEIPEIEDAVDEELVEETEELEKAEELDELEELDQLEETPEELEEISAIEPLEDLEQIIAEVAEEAVEEPEESIEESIEEPEELEELEKLEENIEEDGGEMGVEDNEEISEEIENSEEMVTEEAEEVNGEVAEDSTFVKRNLSPDAKQELKDFISRFTGVKGIDKQILKAMHSVLKTSEDESNFIFIIGDVKSGKTTLAIDIIKVLNKIMENRGRKIAKVPGSSLTGKNMMRFMEKVVESDIVIEKVSSMGEESLKEFVNSVKKSGESKIVIFEDEVITSEKFVRGICEDLNVGDNIIVLKQSRVREWAEIAKEYIKEEGYEIDEMGVLAMHERIDKLHALTLVIQKSHVEQVIDRAIAKHNKKKLSNLFRGSKNNVLTEKDFIEE